MRKLSILFVVMALVIGFSATAMAQQKLFYGEKERLAVAPTKELEVYGSIRFQTYWRDRDWESIGTSAASAQFNDSELVWSLEDSNTQFGVRFKSGKIGGNVEIRPREQNLNSYSGSTNLLRHWYGTYDLGWGTFLFGQTNTPTFNPICRECLVGGGGFLDTYGDMGGSTRKAGLQLHMPIPAMNGLLKLAALEPTSSYKHPASFWASGATAVGGPPAVPATTGAFSATPTQQQVFTSAATGLVASVPTNSGGNTFTGTGTTAYPYTDVDFKIPALEVSLAGAFGPLGFTLRGGYNTFDVANVFNNDDISIDSYLVALDATYSMGPFYIRGSAYWGQNLTAFGKHDPSTQTAMGFLPVITVTGTGATSSAAVDDVDNWGWIGVAGFKFNDMVSLEAGYGQRISEVDTLHSGTIFTDKDKKSAIVVFVPITVTPAFIITPEVLLTDEGDLTIGGVSRDRGKQLYAGVYWRIDF